jgi:hypothetical protein
MSSRAKWTVLTLTMYALFAAATALDVYGTFVRPGMVTFYVHDKGLEPQQFYFSVPAFLPNTVLGLIPASTIRRQICLNDEQVMWNQVVANVAEDIDRAPDFTMVDVQSSDATVKIEKRNHGIHIRVDSPDATVRVVVPPQTIRAATRLVGDV